MFRMSTIAGVAAASMLATTAVFVGATGSVASSPTVETSIAPAPAAQKVASATPSATASASTGVVASEGCGRKVKVVYAGYGEAGLGCATKQ